MAKLLLLGECQIKIPEEIKEIMPKLDFDYILCSGDLTTTKKPSFFNWEESKSQKEILNSNLSYLNSLNKRTFLIYGKHQINELKEFPNIILLKRKKVKIKDNLEIIGISGHKINSKLARQTKALKRLNEKWENKLHLLLKNSKNTVLLTHNFPDELKGDEILTELIKIHKPLISISATKEQSKNQINETVTIHPGNLSNKQITILELINNEIKIEFFN